MFFLAACQSPTFTKDIAPIVYSKCTPCHFAGGSGPFPLVTYEDVVERASLVQKVAQSRYMPPWKPLPGFASYKNDRSLTKDEIQLIRKWVSSGTPIGDSRELPPPPKRKDGWQMGPPDLVIRMPDAFPLPAGGSDIYRNIVIQSPSLTRRYVKAWEFRPGTKVIHHAILNIDRTGWARQRDAGDSAPGFGGMDDGRIQSPDGFFLVWTPGKVPTPATPGSAWVLDSQTDLVLQLHMRPSGKPEQVNPEIGLYFSADPPHLPRFSLKIGDPPIDISPGDRSYKISDSFTFPADVEVLGVFPHAHFLAKTFQVWATLPDRTKKWLLNIDDWDFNWQDEYSFLAPIVLPKGTRVEMAITYDNSTDNFRNPNHPPKRVTNGEASTDEMGNVTFQLAPVHDEELNLLLESKYRRLLRAAGKKATGVAYYNVANAVMRQGRADEAAELFEKAIEVDPKLVQAHFNLGVLEGQRGSFIKAKRHFQNTLKLDPHSKTAQEALLEADRLSKSKR